MAIDGNSTLNGDRILTTNIRSRDGQIIKYHGSDSVHVNKKRTTMEQDSRWIQHI
jgi:hypothetical protein